MKQKGFTLFFALLISSLALAIGLAIFDIAVRETGLAATVTQSQYAVYAADSGAECALYWDAKCSGGTCGDNSAFATSSTFSGATSGIICNGQDIATAAIAAGTWPLAGANSSAATTTFTVTFLPQVYCATVVIAKNGSPSRTTLVSHGYNNCANAGGLQLERTFQVNY